MKVTKQPKLYRKYFQAYINKRFVLRVYDKLLPFNNKTWKNP